MALNVQWYACATVIFTESTVNSPLINDVNPSFLISTIHVQTYVLFYGHSPAGLGYNEDGEDNFDHDICTQIVCELCIRYNINIISRPISGLLWIVIKYSPVTVLKFKDIMHAGKFRYQYS